MRGLSAPSFHWAAQSDVNADSAYERRQGFVANREMLFTPNFFAAPRALSEMNW